jgi:hypothetical protein
MWTRGCNSQDLYSPVTLSIRKERKMLKYDECGIYDEACRTGTCNHKNYSECFPSNKGDEMEINPKVVANPYAVHRMLWDQTGKGICIVLVARPDGRVNTCDEPNDSPVHITDEDIKNRLELTDEQWKIAKHFVTK